MRRKKGDSQEAPPGGDGRVTPVDVQQVEFRLSFRGYNERDVDSFLDRVTEDLAGYIEENQRLRSGSGLSPAISAGASTEDARREAEDIVARARREAEDIVARAHEEAADIAQRAARQAAGSAAAGAATGEARGAVAPFLNREREFLQSLGALVQTHAEDIKQMVLAIRARAESSPEPVAPARAEETSPEDRGDGPVASATEIRDRLGEPEAERTDPPPQVIESSTEPAYSSEGVPAEGRERSLRELFWGED